MKIKIKNYRTLKNTELNIVDGEVNFIVGSNESGKTNILRAIKILAKNQPIPITAADKTLNNDVPENSEMSFIFSYDSNEKRKNLITNDGMHVWIHRDLEYIEEFEKLVDSNFAKLEDCINKIAQIILNPNPKKTSLNDKILMENLIKIKEKKLIPYESINKINKYINSPEFESIYSGVTILAIINKFMNFLNSLRISRPVVHFINPIENANKIEQITYQWADLQNSDSLIKKIFDFFLLDTQKKRLDAILIDYNNLNGDFIDLNLQKNNIIKELNKKILQYFNKNLPILKGCPEFFIDASTLQLNICSNSNKKLNIDTSKESERSLGFKTFLRIILEINALSKNSNDKNIFYIVDELEQALHPIYQEILMDKINELQNNKNITFLISTHSPYILSKASKNKNINFVFRIEENNEDKNQISGETIIYNNHFDKKGVDEMVEKYYDYYWSNENINMSEDVFLIKLLIDSRNLEESNKLIKEEVKKIYKKFESDKNKDEFDQSLNLIKLKKINPYLK